MTAPHLTDSPLHAAPRLLIVHGFGATPQNHWFPWLARAVPGAERIALPDPTSPSGARWVPLVADALERLGDGTAVVAHSLGNATVLQALRRLADTGRPTRLSAFAAVDPFVSSVPPTGDPALDAFLLGRDGGPPAQRAFFEGLDLPALRPLLGAVRVLRSDDDPDPPRSLGRARDAGPVAGPDGPLLGLPAPTDAARSNGRLSLMSTLAPAEAAERTGLTLDTLRYYEREGLIGPIDRAAGGRRLYSEDDVAWIGIVTCLREAGLGIEDLRRFTTLLRSSDEAPDRVAFLRERRAELEERRRATEQALAVLDDKIAYYGAGR